MNISWCRPQIQVKDGNIELRAANGRNISFLSGKGGNMPGFILFDGTPVQGLVCVADVTVFNKFTTRFEISYALFWSGT